MKLVVLQPGYIPWLGFFDQMAQSDTFVFYDDVQFDKNGWRNRNKIKTAQGVQWLTVPIKRQGKVLVKDAMIDNSTDWRGNHLKSIRQNYSRAECFGEYIGTFESVYAQEWEYLIDLDVKLILLLRNMLGIKSRLEFASNLAVNVDRVQRLVDMCAEMGANEFLEGSAGRDYLAGEGERMFVDAGIKLTYQDYRHPVYKQLYGEFVPYLSVVDLLFNCGKDSLSILTGGEGLRGGKNSSGNRWSGVSGEQSGTTSPERTS